MWWRLQIPDVVFSPEQWESVLISFHHCFQSLVSDMTAIFTSSHLSVLRETLKITGAIVKQTKQSRRIVEISLFGAVVSFWTSFEHRCTAAAVAASTRQSRFWKGRGQAERGRKKGNSGSSEIPLTLGTERFITSMQVLTMKKHILHHFLSQAWSLQRNKEQQLQVTSDKFLHNY